MDIIDELEIIITEDGSSSLRRKDLGEGYHSSHGAIAESMHIFINSALNYYKDLNPNQNRINILEIGFGTGLNALLSLSYCQENNIEIYYQSVEKYPLSYDIISKLNYGILVSNQEDFLKLHNTDWQKEEKIGENFILEKIEGNGENLDYKEDFFDIIYFDAFAPQFEENLWRERMFAKLYSSLKTGGILSTYCCKGDVKRALKSSGFKIEKLPGPKGKREILRAVKQ
ncbi:MAG: tRNA (5-methylaminomethyl-2-thiouridine)(34)-methyltransferase MnmD [Bacteroidales bacterium]